MGGSINEYLKFERKIVPYFLYYDKEMFRDVGEIGVRNRGCSEKWVSSVNVTKGKRKGCIRKGVRESKLLGRESKKNPSW